MNKYVLDACALIAYYADEKGADLVKDIVRKAYFEESQVLINDDCIGVTADHHEFDIVKNKENITLLWIR